MPGQTAAPLLASSASPVPEAGASELTGALGFDTVEGGCSYLETPDGTRYEMVYPKGWLVASGRLVGPGGVSVASGQRVTVKGALSNEIATICQVGPVFLVSEVLPAG